MKPPHRRPLSIDVVRPRRGALGDAAPPGPTTRMAEAEGGPTAPWPEVPDHIRPARPRPRQPLEARATATPPEGHDPAQAAREAAAEEGPPDAARPRAERAPAPAPPGGGALFGPRFGEIPTHPSGPRDPVRPVDRRISAIFPAVPLVASIPILPPSDG